MIDPQTTTNREILAERTFWPLLDMSEDERIQLLESRVAAGIALLNEREWSEPWYFVVNLDALSIADPYNCVLGQVFGDYTGALEVLGLRLGIGHGFSGAYEGALTKMWKESILKLRADHVQ